MILSFSEHNCVKMWKNMSYITQVESSLSSAAVVSLNISWTFGSSNFDQRIFQWNFSVQSLPSYVIDRILLSLIIESSWFAITAFEQSHSFSSLMMITSMVFIIDQKNEISCAILGQLVSGVSLVTNGEVFRARRMLPRKRMQNQSMKISEISTERNSKQQDEYHQPFDNLYQIWRDQLKRSFYAFCQSDSRGLIKTLRSSKIWQSSRDEKDDDRNNLQGKVLLLQTS